MQRSQSDEHLILPRWTQGFQHAVYALPTVLLGESDSGSFPTVCFRVLLAKCKMYSPKPSKLMGQAWKNRSDPPSYCSKALVTGPRHSKRSPSRSIFWMFSSSCQLWSSRETDPTAIHPTMVSLWPCPRRSQGNISFPMYWAGKAPRTRLCSKYCSNPAGCIGAQNMVCSIQRKLRIAPSSASSRHCARLSLSL